MEAGRGTGSCQEIRRECCRCLQLRSQGQQGRPEPGRCEDDAAHPGNCPPSRVCAVRVPGIFPPGRGLEDTVRGPPWRVAASFSSGPTPPEAVSPLASGDGRRLRIRCTRSTICTKGTGRGSGGKDRPTGESRSLGGVQGAGRAKRSRHVGGCFFGVKWRASPAPHYGTARKDPRLSAGRRPVRGCPLLSGQSAGGLTPSGPATRTERSAAPPGLSCSTPAGFAGDPP